MGYGHFERIAAKAGCRASALRKVSAMGRIAGRLRGSGVASVPIVAPCAAQNVKPPRG